MNKSRVKLTREEEEFFSMIRYRASSEKVGQPLISHALFRLIPVSAPGLGTMAVDKYFRVYIDFEFMMDKGIEFATQVLNHEPWHILKNHPQRADDLGSSINHKIWNIAADAEINDDIVSLIPSISVFPKSFGAEDDNTAEYYYSLLMKMQKQENAEKEKNKPQSDSPEKSDEDGEDGENGEDGSEPGQSSEKPGNNDSTGQSSGGTEESDDQKKGQPKKDDSNSGQEENTPSSIPNNEVCGTGEEKVREYLLSEDDADSVSEFDKELILSEIAKRVQEEHNRNPGNVPAHMKLWADNLIKETPTPWQKILRPTIKTAIEWTKKSKLDYHQKTPARRQPVEGIRYPALRSPSPRLLVGVDTSGSHIPMLPHVMNEFNTIIKSSGIRGRNLQMVSIDTELKNKPKVINNIKDVKFAGGGGTSMLPFFDLAKIMRKKIDIAILLTDGEVPGWYAEKPTNGVLFIVCILGPLESQYLDRSYQNAVDKMPWAKVIKIGVPDHEL